MIKTFEKPLDVAEAFADFFYTAYEEKKAKGEELTIALSGGNTPKIVFHLLKDKYKDKIDWNTIHFFWGDERMVPSDSEESNYGVAKQIFFDNIKISKANIHYINGEEAPKKEASRYACDINSYVPAFDGLPRFDIIMLGLGTDGHTLSIFPNQIDLIRSQNVCDVAVHPQSGQTRVTLSGKVANNAKNIVFLVTGENKAGILKTIINKKEGFQTYPASFINPDSGKIFWFVDSGAAKDL